MKRLILAICATLLLISAVCNLTFTWRNANMHRDLFAVQSRLQALNLTQQIMPTIAQDLVNQTQQYPWLAPILQRYLRAAGQPAPAAQPAPAPVAPAEPANGSARKKNP